MFSHLRPISALWFHNKFSASFMPGTILSAWDISVTKKQDQYMPLFTDEVAEAQTYRAACLKPKTEVSEKDLKTGL